MKGGKLKNFRKVGCYKSFILQIKDYFKFFLKERFFIKNYDECYGKIKIYIF